MKTDIRIIDYSILTPWGDNVNNIISILNEEKKYNLKRKIDDYDVKLYLGSKGYRYYSMQTKYLLSSILPLWERNFDKMPLENVGISTGSCFASLEDWVCLCNHIKKGGFEEIPPMDSFNFSLNIPSSIASIRTKAHSFNVTHTSGIMSGYDAINFSLDNLMLKTAESVIACGVEYMGENVNGFLKSSSSLCDSIEGSSAILFSNDTMKPYWAKIISYNSNFIPKSEYSNYNSYKEYFIGNILTTHKDADFCEVDIIISIITGEQAVKDFEIQLLSDMFPNTPILNLNDKLGNLLSLNGDLQYILACKVLNGQLLDSIKDKKQFNSALILYSTNEGYVYSSIIKK